MEQLPAKSPTIIYLLAFPYSGSTLISLAMGNGGDLLNLGEVYFLEHDYKKHKQCLCGEELMNCSFWQGMKHSLAVTQKASNSPSEIFDLSDSAHLHVIDYRKKSTMTQLKRAVGMPARKIYKDTLVQEYIRKNELFFSAASSETSKMFLVDASKSPDRLNVLSKGMSNIRVIWLKRNLKNLFASKIKRAKKRSKYYSPLFSIYYIVWVLHHFFSCKREYDSFSNDQRMIIYYEDFVDQPHAIERKLSDWLGADVNFGLTSDNAFDITGQHLYVGNMWVFKQQTKNILIRKMGRDTELGAIEKITYSLCAKLIPVLKS